MTKPLCSILAMVLVVAAGYAGGTEPGLAIHEEAPSCFIAEAYPRLAVQITPADQVVRARVLFRPDTQLTMPSAAGSEPEPATPQQWYAVAMKRSGESFTAVLPRPRMGVGRVRYVVEATDAAAATVRGGERSVEVVGGPGACGARKTAESAVTADVEVEVPPGAPWTPPVPQGFSPVGATASGNLPGVGKKGGHKGLLIGIGAAVAAGAGAASLASHSPTQAPIEPPIPPHTGDVVLVSSSPIAGSTIHGTQPNLSVILRIVLPETTAGSRVEARLYRFGSTGLQCGTLNGVTNAGSANAAVTVQLQGLDAFAPCGIVDRLHVSVIDAQGRETLVTGTSARPDLITNFFLAL